MMARGTAEAATDNAAVVARLSAILTNPDFCDLSLLSNEDGTKTAASAMMLASCSPVFLTMLTGSFAEGAARDRKMSRSSLDTDAPTASSALPAVSVCSEFSGAALGAVVSFAATNDAAVLWDGSGEVLGEVLEASEYYDIEDLKIKAKRQLAARARQVPQEACQVLQAVWERWVADGFPNSPVGDGSAGEVAETALAVIDNSADAALTGCGCLCEEAMKEVLGRKNIRVGEAHLFSALESWFRVDGMERRSAARRLVSCIDLERIPPSFLADKVAKSGLVSQEKLLVAFQSHSLKVEASQGFDAPPRDCKSLLNWCGTETVEHVGVSGELSLAFSDCSLSSGCWSWDIQVEKYCYDLSIGLARADVDSNTSLGHQEGGYACGSDGKTNSGRFSTGSRTGPKFFAGDIVRITVDFDAGTLNISVNDGEPHEVFTGIAKVEDCVKDYRPAVSLLSYNTFESPGRVRVLKFKGVTPL